jgi:hypothetical protein
VVSYDAVAQYIEFKRFVPIEAGMVKMLLSKVFGSRHERDGDAADRRRSTVTAEWRAAREAELQGRRTVSPSSTSARIDIERASPS